MRRGALRYLSAVLFVSLLVAGCGGEERGKRPSPQDNTSAGTTVGAAGAAEADEPAANGGGEPSWSMSGRESGGSEGAADGIRDVEFDYLGGYERVRIAFDSGEGEASGIPRWSVEKAPEGGYLRLFFPGVTSTQTAGEDLAGLTADAYYVVHQSDGGLFVDVLALGAFEYRVTELTEAGQLAVDFRDAPGGLTCPAVQAESTVVTQPCEAEEVAAGEPLAVEGYAREPGDSLTLVLVNEEGEPMATQTVRPNDGNEAWEPFEASVAVPSSYEGLATLRVTGGQRPADEAPVRTEVPVFVGVGQDEQPG